MGLSSSGTAPFPQATISILRPRVTGIACRNFAATTLADPVEALSGRTRYFYLQPTRASGRLREPAQVRPHWRPDAKASRVQRLPTQCVLSWEVWHLL